MSNDNYRHANDVCGNTANCSPAAAKKNGIVRGNPEEHSWELLAPLLDECVNTTKTNTVDGYR